MIRYIMSGGPDPKRAGPSVAWLSLLWPFVFPLSCLFVDDCLEGRYGRTVHPRVQVHHHLVDSTISHNHTHKSLCGSRRYVLLVLFVWPDLLALDDWDVQIEHQQLGRERSHNWQGRRRVTQDGRHAAPPTTPHKVRYHKTWSPPFDVSAVRLSVCAVSQSVSPPDELRLHVENGRVDIVSAAALRH